MAHHAPGGCNKGDSCSFKHESPGHPRFQPWYVKNFQGRPDGQSTASEASPSDEFAYIDRSGEKSQDGDSYEVPVTSDSMWSSWDDVPDSPPDLILHRKVFSKFSVVQVDSQQR